MKSGGWVPISKYLIGSLPRDREYTELEAAYSLSFDYDNRAEVSVLGYSQLWGWSRTRVIRFLGEMGVELERIDPGSRKSLSRLKINQQQDNEKASKKHKRMIDSRCLASEKNNNNATKGQQEGTPDKPLSSDPLKTPPGQMVGGEKNEGKDQSADQGDYLRLLERYGEVRSFSALADFKFRQWIEQGGMSVRDYEQLAEWRRVEKRGLLNIAKQGELHAVDQKQEEIAVSGFASNLAALPEETRAVIRRLSDKEFSP